MTRQTDKKPLVLEDSGVATAWWVLWMIGFMVFGGVAIDSANAWRMRAQLQFAADAAAHAAAIKLPNAANARAAAESIAEKNMPASDHGDVLAAADVEVGIWDPATKIFTPNATDDGGVVGVVGVLPPPPPPAAVRVVTRRAASNANQLRTSFLRLIGFDVWDVEAEAVAERYFPGCNMSSALIARRVVDMQSNNRLKSGLCIHGNDHVEVNNENNWDPGVRVTMPDLADFVVPNNDINYHNPGLANALGEEYFDPKIVDYAGQIISQLTVLGSPYIPSYIGKDASGNSIPTNKIVVNTTAARLHQTGVQQGYIYYAPCNVDNQLLVLGSSGAVIRNVVIVTDCRIFTGQGVTLENVILASTAGDKNISDNYYPYSINIGQDSRLGANDACAPGGGVKLISSGGTIHSSASISAYELQAIAVRDIRLAAREKGLSGILLQAGNDVSITSNNSFGDNCGLAEAFQVPYFRLVL